MQLKAQEGVVAPAVELFRLAAVLPLAGLDADLACAYAGISARGSRAEQLVVQARAAHAELISGEPAALDRVMRAGILQLAIGAALQPEQIAPGQRPQAAFVLARLRESMGLTTAPRFATMTMTITGPDGAVVTIGPSNHPKGSQS